MNKCQTSPQKHIVAPETCTGCGLCANVCPRDAITMEWSDAGFLVPKVNAERCIECGLCTRHCIATDKAPDDEANPQEQESYAAWNKNTALRMQSSSGGVFSALAEYVISQGGCVFGVAWKDVSTAAFMKAETVEQLAALRGSKYTQALPSFVYREVREELRHRPVLFCGTPCQVHALKSFLGKPHERLLTMDIVCHGVPSRLLLEAYVAEAERTAGRRLERITFRDKSEGWLNYHVRRTYCDGSHEVGIFLQDVYMRLFLSDVALNRSCYNCPCARLPRPGDVSIGDYWGVQRHHEDWPIAQGISSVLVNTDAGRRALSGLAEKLELHKEPFARILAGQPHSYRSSGHPISRMREKVLQAAAAKRVSLRKMWGWLQFWQIGPLRISKNAHWVSSLRRLVRRK